ncbi:HEPN domain-containing protein [Cronobacter sakazakii]|uniref:HEPN domain-containing protein n=1 Tax=Cronobacter sakazakii TaxID=28141 RepID=UPI000BE8BFE7|nr:HEPN domain-containing protein [Cronobacter sakazakii]ELY2511308.1 hypothetical protein [Cronobacter sakazakii]ELY4529009.1 hypothetical protein [Cronobacter sakazakii]ELY6309793.1 hypothetical protein [Cronobacter sakazakii]MDK1066966.1 HEPN domain-containing protein [Cronobacter sakazakii]PQX60124.1 hypothetical protein C5934_21355 [Cronobacter sakazakii]
MANNHPGKIENLKNKIRILVDGTDLINGIACFSKNIGNDIKKLAVELSKNKSYQFDEISAMFAYLDSIKYYGKHIRCFDQEETSCQDLQPKEKDDLVDFSCNYLLSIPFSYEITIPLNNLSLPSFSDCKRFSIEHKIKSKASMGFALSGESEVAQTNICVPSIGYYNIYEKDYFMKEATIVLNVLIYSLRAKNVIERNYNKSVQRTINWSPIFDRKQYITELWAKIINNDYPQSIDEHSFSIPTAMYLEELEMVSGMHEDELKNLTLEALEEATRLLDDTSDEAQNIVSAIDWCIQSEINHDKTMSFLQICMGLEALLGDNTNDAGLTLTLTDRCAYLIGKGMAERAEIKKEFKAIYQLRSKLVHGRMNKISTQDRALCIKAIKYLKRAISKELSYLMENNER